MKIEIEIQRSNVSPSQFLSYVRKQVDAKGGRGIRGDLELSYFAAGDDLNYNVDHKKADDDCYKSGCEREISVSHPYDMQTYIKNADGTMYNEICQFDFWDGKTGTGYYYLCNIN